MTQSYQKGTIQKRPRRDGTLAYRLAWRERQSDAQWVQRTMTMPPGSTSKEARIKLDQILDKVNDRNGQSAEADPSLTFGGFVGRHWEAYQKNQALRPRSLSAIRNLEKSEAERPIAISG